MKHVLTLTLIAAVTLSAAAAMGRSVLPEPTKPVDGQVILSWDEFVRITGYDPTQKSGQVLTIPWSEVQSILGDDIKLPNVSGATKVDLPWQDFKALLEWSVQRKQAATAETPPPTDYVVRSTQYTCKLYDDRAEFRLTLKLDVLRKRGWKRIRLLPDSVAVTGAETPEGGYIHVDNGAYELLLGETAGQVEVVVDFVVAVQTSAGVRSVTLPRLLAGAAVLDLTYEQANTEVAVVGAQSQVTKRDSTGIHVAAAIGGTEPIRITVKRSLPAVKAVPAKLYAESRTLVAVGEGMLLCEQKVHLNILHTPIREVKLRVPDAVSVLTVNGPGIRDWRAVDNELVILLEKEPIGSYAFTVHYEQPVTDAAVAPILRPLNVERNRGYVAVIALSNVEITGDNPEGARSVDVRRLGGEMVAMTHQPILLAYRYVGEQVTIPLTIKRHTAVSLLVTVVDSAHFTTMQLNDGKRITKAVYAVRNNRSQFLRLSLPTDSEIWSASVGGNAVTAASDPTGKVLIPLIRSSGNAAYLQSFPVEVVYVETPATPAAAAGTVRVNLPVTHVPAMHVMVDCYLPAEGKYGRKGGWGSKDTTGFTGPMQRVDEFASLTTGSGNDIIDAPANRAPQMLQQLAQQRFEANARAAGVTPIRVKLPLAGTRFRLEKILALPGDQLWFQVAYKGWTSAQ